jgi:hypothetical protein
MHDQKVAKSRLNIVINALGCSWWRSNCWHEHLSLQELSLLVNKSADEIINDNAEIFCTLFSTTDD